MFLQIVSMCTDQTVRCHIPQGSELLTLIIIIIISSSSGGSSSSSSSGSSSSSSGSSSSSSSSSGSSSGSSSSGGGGGGGGSSSSSKILKEEIDSKCQLCTQHEETIDHLISRYFILTKNEYVMRHNVCAHLHYSLCKA